jgi:hypothetical protein
VKIELDYEKIHDIEMSIDTSDAPDFADCHITGFTYGDREATSEEVDALNDDHDFVYEQTLKRVY